MKPNFTKSLSPELEQQIISEEEKYNKALKRDANFEILKDIKDNIKRLKAA